MASSNEEIRMWAVEKAVQMRPNATPAEIVKDAAEFEKFITGEK